MTPPVIRFASLGLAILMMTFVTTHAADWKPAQGPLMTRFAKDVSPEHALPEYPRPQMVRKEWENLNGLWQFASADDVKEAPVGKDLPGQILVPFCMESALSGVGKHHDKSWYRRTFDVPKGWKDQRILLHFGAVDYESTVWVNGKEMGKHVGGYDGFSYDITDALKSSGPQEVIVGVTDTTDETQPRGKQVMNPHGIWYTPVSGIWQTVWIEPVQKRAHIRSIKLRPDVDQGAVFVSADVAGDAKEVLLHATLGPDEQGVKGPVGTELKLPVPDAKLWSPDSPHLYDLKVHLHPAENGKPLAELIDGVDSYFGMRKIEVSPDEKGIPRIKLNGKVILQVGPLDQGWWPDGLYTAPTDEALKYDLDVTKKLGFNMIRKHVKVEPQRWYYHADKMGFLVWQDMPNAHAYEAGPWQKQFETELKALIEQHFNSPSIVMWVPLNEGWGQDARKKGDTPLGKAPYDKAGTIALGDKVKSWDPTRLVNHASGWTDHGGGDVNDIHAYPGPAAPKVEEKRAIVLGEFGGLGLPVQGHLWQSDKNWGYQNMSSKDELTGRYVRLLGRLWQLMEKDGLCAGVYTQTTDVEGEVNGLLTYDREVLKLDESRVREANTGKGPRVDIVPVLKTARDEPADWKYTTEKPGEGWNKPGFDDASWKTGKSGFGAKDTQAATVGTEWTTPDVWLRREVELGADAMKDVALYVRHDDEAVVFINGVQASRLRGASGDYIERPLRADKNPLKPGKNLIAVHCNNAGGPQYIDVGLVRLVETKPTKE